MYSFSAWLGSEGSVLFIKSTLAVSSGGGRKLVNLIIAVDLNEGEIVYTGPSLPRSSASTAPNSGKGRAHAAAVEGIYKAVGLDPANYSVELFEVDSRGSAKLLLVRAESRATSYFLMATWAAIVDGSGRVEYLKYIKGYMLELAVDASDGLVALKILRENREDVLTIYKYSFSTPLPPAFIPGHVEAG